MPLNPSRDLVLKKLRDCFADDADVSAASRSLDFYHDDFGLTDLVRLAIIKLSDGKLWRLRDYVKIAKKDARDVIYLAQSPEIMADGKKSRNSIRRGLKVTSKPLSPAKETAMRKRDAQQ